MTKFGNEIASIERGGFKLAKHFGHSVVLVEPSAKITTMSQPSIRTQKSCIYWQKSERIGIAFRGVRPGGENTHSKGEHREYELFKTH